MAIAKTRTVTCDYTGLPLEEGGKVVAPLYVTVSGQVYARRSDGSSVSLTEWGEKGPPMHTFVDSTALAGWVDDRIREKLPGELPEIDDEAVDSE